MNNLKDHDHDIFVDTSSMGTSHPLVPQGTAQGGYPHASAPQAYPQNFQGGHTQQPPQLGFQPGFHVPQAYPQGQDVAQQNVYVPPPPGYKPVFEDNSINTTQGVGEDGEFKQFDFTEKSIRRAFIKKVYGILMCQLLISLAFIALFLFCEPVKHWAAGNMFMLIVALAIYFVMALSLICCGDLRRKAPANFIFLGMFTLATSYLLGIVTSCYDVDIVMIAVGITAAVVLSLTLFAFQTKYDFTGMGSALLCALVILILFGFISAFMPNRVMEVLYSAAGAMIFSLYIIYDTQLMLGGKHKYTITPEEYIFAALNLYLDVINLFLHILALMGRNS